MRMMAFVVLMLLAGCAEYPRRPAATDAARHLHWLPSPSQPNY
jgi:hypothetical protein